MAGVYVCPDAADGVGDRLKSKAEEAAVLGTIGEGA